ncbi:transcription factor ILR3-like isoform X1 [Cucurbita pepo subsp. pepo]|uniref:transcription factor ILR3-like isoform X1 n=1 Tax=Cucurbita pepo subsp. pepo TaxID=3664 RepID=UPI000C9D353C|nr:transcription factor ILR3-like isoform X1 [Cucurbita pepo subsp. pepo]
MKSPEITDWVFDYALIEDFPVPGGDLPSLDLPVFTLSSRDFTASFSVLREDFDEAHGKLNDIKESGSRKRMSSGSGASLSKAHKEKVRRNRLNDRFLELNSILNHGTSPKIDKSVILGDAVRMILQLRDEAQKLKESNENFLEKINEMKAEKNELRDEKQRLKEAKDNLKQKMKTFITQPSFLPHPSAFSAPNHVVGAKFVPVIGYPGVSMWKLMPQGAIDTSQDHVLRPPVA